MKILGIYLHCSNKVDFMINEYMFNEVMSKPLGTSLSIALSIDKMMKFCNDIKLLTNEKNDVFYQVDANVVKNNVEELSDLMELNQGGWVLTEDKKFLEFYL